MGFYKPKKIVELLGLNLLKINSFPVFVGFFGGAKVCVCAHEDAELWVVFSNVRLKSKTESAIGNRL